MKVYRILILFSFLQVSLFADPDVTSSLEALRGKLELLSSQLGTLKNALMTLNENVQEEAEGSGPDVEIKQIDSEDIAILKQPVTDKVADTGLKKNDAYKKGEVEGEGNLEWQQKILKKYIKEDKPSQEQLFSFFDQLKKEGVSSEKFPLLYQKLFETVIGTHEVASDQVIDKLFNDLNNRGLTENMASPCVTSVMKNVFDREVQGLQKVKERFDKLVLKERVSDFCNLLFTEGEIDALNAQRLHAFLTIDGLKKLPRQIKEFQLTASLDDPDIKDLDDQGIKDVDEQVIKKIVEARPFLYKERVGHIDRELLLTLPCLIALQSSLENFEHVLDELFAMECGILDQELIPDGVGSEEPPINIIQFLFKNYYQYYELEYSGKLDEMSSEDLEVLNNTFNKSIAELFYLFDSLCKSNKITGYDSLPSFISSIPEFFPHPSLIQKPEKDYYLDYKVKVDEVRDKINAEGENIDELSEQEFEEVIQEIIKSSNISQSLKDHINKLTKEVEPFVKKVNQDGYKNIKAGDYLLVTFLMYMSQEDYFESLVPAQQNLSMIIKKIEELIKTLVKLNYLEKNNFNDKVPMGRRRYVFLSSLVYDVLSRFDQNKNVVALVQGMKDLGFVIHHDDIETQNKLIEASGQGGTVDGLFKLVAKLRKSGTNIEDWDALQIHVINTFLMQYVVKEEDGSYFKGLSKEKINIFIRDFNDKKLHQGLAGIDSGSLYYPFNAVRENYQKLDDEQKKLLQLFQDKIQELVERDRVRFFARSLFEKKALEINNKVFKELTNKEKLEQLASNVIETNLLTDEFARKHGIAKWPAKNGDILTNKEKLEQLASNVIETNLLTDEFARKHGIAKWPAKNGDIKYDEKVKTALAHQKFALYKDYAGEKVFAENVSLAQAILFITPVDKLQSMNTILIDLGYGDGLLTTLEIKDSDETITVNIPQLQLIRCLYEMFNATRMRHNTSVISYLLHHFEKEITKHNIPEGKIWHEWLGTIASELNWYFMEHDYVKLDGKVGADIEQKGKALYEESFKKFEKKKKSESSYMYSGNYMWE